jgi:biopolymer transport protein ExbD
MKIRKKHQDSVNNAEINLTAMLDVVFSILAFFILISAALTVPKGIGVDLPIGASTNSNAVSGEVKPEDMLVITLDPAGQMLSDGRSITPQQLEQEIRNFLARSTQGIVVLSADNANVSYQVVINRLAELRVIAGNRVAIATSRS